MLKYSLTTGLVIAGAFAMKLRRALFAQMKQSVKAGQISQEEVARASGELNTFLYTILVDRLRVSKGDVVRVRVDYTVEDGKIVWDVDALKLEVFRRVSDEEVQRVLAEVRAEQGSAGANN